MCKKTETLKVVMERIAKAEVRQASRGGGEIGGVGKGGGGGKMRGRGRRLCGEWRKYGGREQVSELFHQRWDARWDMNKHVNKPSTPYEELVPCPCLLSCALQVWRRLRRWIVWIVSINSELIWSECPPWNKKKHSNDVYFSSLVDVCAYLHNEMTSLL